MISHLRGGLEDPRKVQSIEFDEKNSVTSSSRTVVNPYRYTRSADTCLSTKYSLLFYCLFSSRGPATILECSEKPSDTLLNDLMAD